MEGRRSTGSSAAATAAPSAFLTPAETGSETGFAPTASSSAAGTGPPAVASSNAEATALKIAALPGGTSVAASRAGRADDGNEERRMGLPGGNP
jgi:hypothetical protein